jgi:hypothetical protein
MARQPLASVHATPSHLAFPHLLHRLIVIANEGQLPETKAMTDQSYNGCASLYAVAMGFMNRSGFFTRGKFIKRGSSAEQSRVEVFDAIITPLLEKWYVPSLTAPSSPE